MGQTPPKMFAQPMSFGASQANNVVQQSQPTAQAPQPQTPYLSLNQDYSQTSPLGQSGLGQQKAPANPYQNNHLAMVLRQLDPRF